MSLSASFKKIINNLTPGAYKVKLGDLLDGAIEASQPATSSTAGTVKQGAAVAAAAGATPTKAEFDALLVSLRAAGVIAAS
jgi:hypothetical protein